jgi:PBSX family phage terminase large subunit
MSQVKEITLHPFQWEAFNAINEHRFTGLISGVQGGKTFLGALWLGHRALNDPDSNHLIAFPTHKIGLQSTLPKFFEIYPQFRRFFNQTAGEISIPGGEGKIFVRSTDNPVTLEGMTIASAWLDEAGQMKADTWLMIQARTAIKQGRVMFTTTPYNMGWLYTEVYKRWQDGDKDYHVVQYRSVDNPYFPQEEFERAKKTLDSRIFAMRYMGKFEKMEGLVYQDFDHFNIEKKEKIVPVATLGSIDWGYQAPAGIVIVQLDDQGVYHVIDEFYESQKTTTELIEVARHFAEKYKVNRWYGDAAEPDRIEEFKRAGFYMFPGVKDMKAGINKVRQLILERKLKVQDNCVHFIDEMANYHYEKPEFGKLPSENPVKEYDHLLDALRYMISTYHHDRNFFTNVKKKLFNNKRKSEKKYDPVTGRLLS